MMGQSRTILGQSRAIFVHVFLVYWIFVRLRKLTRGAHFISSCFDVLGLA